jgi:hypothetical protein
MRSLKSGLFAFMLTGLLGAAAVVGCSASGDGVAIDTAQIPTEPDPGSSGGSTLPPKGTDPTPPADGGLDSSKKDAAPKAEAGVDAGPPPPVEGTACPMLNAIAQKPCGACGKAETVCLADSTGKGKWSVYGTCNNELAGGCVPGTTVNEACGNCGTQVKTCTQYCAYSVAACTGQPVDSCVPGTVDYTTAGCAAATYRNRTCGAACTYGGYSATCQEPVNANKMTISATPGAVVSAQWTLAASQVGKKISGTCGGSASVSSSANYAWVAVEVKNPNATQKATIQIYHSGSGAPLDTLLWVYNKTLPPNTDAMLTACDLGAADSCLAGDPCGNLSAVPAGTSLDWAGLDNVTIPAGGKILVYSSGYTSSVLGNFNLNLKTVKFGP